MTDNEIKEMYKSLAEGNRWECRNLNEYCSFQPSWECKSVEYHHVGDWQPFNLGDEIHKDWEYRKVITWIDEKFSLNTKDMDLFLYNNAARYGATEFAKELIKELDDLYATREIERIKKMMRYLGIKCEG